MEAFEYRSARCSQSGVNVALFAPSAFTEKRPRNLMPWLCETTSEYVAFKHAQVPDSPRICRREQYLVKGRLPYPANSSSFRHLRVMMSGVCCGMAKQGAPGHGYTDSRPSQRQSSLAH